jgi:prefoldin subunit 5
VEESPGILPPADPDRVAKLEAEIEQLRQQLSDLQTQFAELRKQFE